MKLIKKSFAAACFTKTALSTLLVCALVACSDEHEDDNHPKTSFSKIQLSEVYTGDAQPITISHAYTYNAGRLFGYTFKQAYFAVEAVELKTTTTVAYSNHRSIVTDGFGNVSTYTLNDEGYAISCIRKEAGGNTRSYTFSYLTDTEGNYYLEKLTEMLDDGKVYATIDIDHSNYKALRIAQHVNTHEQVYTAITPATNERVNLAEIPCLFLAELYPLSLHSVALYGKLLGEPFKALISQIIPDGTTDSNETTTYTYLIDNRGIVTSCTETTNVYYKRTVSYVIE